MTHSRTHRKYTNDAYRATTKPLFSFIAAIAFLAAMATYHNYASSHAKIKVIAEDWSRTDGITPEDYFGIEAVIPGELKHLGEKFKNVYRTNNILFNCDSYMESHPNEYAYCGRNTVTIMSHTMPDKKLFTVIKWEPK